MSNSPDLVIRGGTVIDGSGGEPFEADVSIAGKYIDAVGSNLPAAAPFELETEPEAKPLPARPEPEPELAVDLV